MGVREEQRKLKRQGKNAPPPPKVDWWRRPTVGNILVIGAAISLQFTIILLPLVGPAGSVAPHALQNKLAWHAVLLTCIALGLLATFSKLGRRKEDQSRFPFLSVLIVGIGVLLLILQATGALRI